MTHFSVEGSNECASVNLIGMDFRVISVNSMNNCLAILSLLLHWKNSHQSKFKNGALTESNFKDQGRRLFWMRWLELYLLWKIADYNHTILLTQFTIWLWKRSSFSISKTQYNNFLQTKIYIIQTVFCRLLVQIKSTRKICLLK